MDNPSIAEKGGGGETSTQLFCLRWNNYQNNLANVFDNLLHSGVLVDCTIVPYEGADAAIKVHKLVLSACSPYFLSVLSQTNCKHPVIILKDVKETELKSVVDFMYKGEINVSQEQIGPLLKVAESLKIRGLADVNNEQDITSEHKSPSATTASSAGDEMNRSHVRGNSSNVPIPTKKRRKASTDRGSSTNTEETLSVINSPSRALEVVTSPSSSVGNGPSLPGCGIMSVAGVQNSAHSGGNRPSQSSTPQSPPNMNSSLSLPPPSATLPGTSVADDMEIKPGIAEMIREEERAKMIESTHAAWLNPAASSIAYHQQSPRLTTPPLQVPIPTPPLQIPMPTPSLQMPIPTPPLQIPINGNNNNTGTNNSTASLKVKSPMWTQAQLKEAIQAVTTQQMRFTDAATRFRIPKGTLYDNILGKQKRMLVLQAVGLTEDEEKAVLKFCCDMSNSQYNRRTYRLLNEILAYVEYLRQKSDPNFEFEDALTGYRWWWAFCKKHSIVSAHFTANKSNSTSQPDTDQSGAACGGISIYTENEGPYDFSIRDSSNMNRDMLSPRPLNDSPPACRSFQDLPPACRALQEELNMIMELGHSNNINKFSPGIRGAMRKKTSPFCL